MKYLLYLIIFITFIPYFVFASSYEKEEAEINKQIKEDYKGVIEKLNKYKSSDKNAFTCGDRVPFWHEFFGKDNKYMIMQCAYAVLQFDSETEEPARYKGKLSYYTYGLFVNIWKKNNAGIFEPLKLYINFPYAYSYSPYGISGHSLNFVKNKNYFTLESESQPLDYELYYTFVEIGDDLYLHKISQEYYGDDDLSNPEVQVFYQYKKGENRINVKSLSDKLIKDLTVGINGGHNTDTIEEITIR